LAEARLKIAVFIDFDNIEIGVKTTLNRAFDVGTVLEAIKERGEVVTKFAYGDWQRAGDHSRQLTQHAIHMVQRNLTPGGDKNGADINLALDALEMAFTHNHINAFVIVSGDSDFIALVEKLKQYDKKVFVVGGRAFTSTILQKNCNEFIAYENLIGSQQPGRRSVDRGRPVAVGTTGDGNLAQVFPLVKRALQVLSEREVSPQLGLLKSTLLQLDSTFSEREYGAGTFRDFVQKLAKAGLVNLKGTDRSVHVELRDADGAVPSREWRDGDATHSVQPGPIASARPSAPLPPAASEDGEHEETTEGGATRDEEATVQATGSSAMQPAEAMEAIRSIFRKATAVPRWPMYVRNVKQFLKANDETFDERRYGFQGILDALRFAQREGIFRLERDRRGILRVFPGAQLLAMAATGAVDVTGAGHLAPTVRADGAGDDPPDDQIAILGPARGRRSHPTDRVSSSSRAVPTPDPATVSAPPEGSTRPPDESGVPADGEAAFTPRGGEETETVPPGSSAATQKTRRTRAAGAPSARKRTPRAAGVRKTSPRPRKSKAPL
jgi:uncharacterized LabA/DUF88 family protein